MLCRAVWRPSVAAERQRTAGAIRWVSRATLARQKQQQESRRAKYEGLPAGWQAVIGVEVHAQLKSKRKLFSSAWSESNDEGQGMENSLVAPFDAALPGSLPRLQREPVRLAIRACLALQCEVAETTTFDRKHYFYPDLTSGYQITQKYAPLARNGNLPLLFDDGHLSNAENETTVRIEQVQLEQDTAKSTHSSTHSSSSTVVDLNRAGCALVEIVSGPDMRSAEQAGAYVRKLQEILRRTGVSDGNMNQGSLRCDVNVSIHRDGQPWGVRCEVKNLNSIRFVMNAIGYEMHRQHELLSSGKIVEQETRGYDELSAKTYRLRSKEDSPDYRYMPDPNLPAVQLTADMVASIRNEMPEPLSQQRTRLMEQYRLPLRDVNVLLRIGLEEERVAIDPVEYFEQVCKGRDAKVTLNWIIQVLLGALNAKEKTFADNSLEAVSLGQLIDLVQDGTITSATARALVEELVTDGAALQLEPHLSSPNAVLSLLSARKWLALSSGDALTELCRQVIQDLPLESSKVRKGNQKVVMRLVGEVMKRTKGRADAQLAQEVFLDLLRD